MSQKRNDNHPKTGKPPVAGLDAELLETDEVNAGEAPGRRNGDRESHHASAQPRPVRPRQA